MRPTEQASMTPAHVEAFKAMIRDAPHINLVDARFALDEAERVCSEFLRSPAVLEALPGASADEDVGILASLKAAGAAAPENSAVARAWIRFQHLDVAASEWRVLIAVLEEDKGR